MELISFTFIEIIYIIFLSFSKITFLDFEIFRKEYQITEVQKVLGRGFSVVAYGFVEFPPLSFIN